MLYRENRPKDLSELVGQENIKKVLSSLAESNNFPHAMLFVGVRGTGKTSSAKIVARTLNCEHPSTKGPCNTCKNCQDILAGKSFDVIEIDGATNNSVDDIRALKEVFKTVSVMENRVIIIDEVHQLSSSAFSSLLKIMEEPPKGVYFILCTTERHKIPITIMSRCAEFNFQAIDEIDIASKLVSICEKHNKEYELDALYLIAKAANGGMRDAESILNVIFVNDKITLEDTRDMLGVITEDSVFNIVNSIILSNSIDCITGINNVADTGRSMWLLLNDLLEVITDCIKYIQTCDIKCIANTASYKEHIVDISKSCDTTRLFEYIEEISNLKIRISSDNNPKIAVQSALLKLINSNNKSDEVDKLKKVVAELQYKINELEKKVFNVFIQEDNSCENINKHSNAFYATNAADVNGQTVDKNNNKDCGDKYLNSNKKPPFAALVGGNAKVFEKNIDKSKDNNNIGINCNSHKQASEDGDKKEECPLQHQSKNGFDFGLFSF